MDGFNQALVDCIKAAGGSAIVGKKMFPEKKPEAAQRALLDCMSEDRPAKLSPEQVLFVLRLAREKGYHGGVAYLLEDLGYAPTTPIEPKDIDADLQRQFIECMGKADRLVERMERLRPQLRHAA